MFSLFPLHPVFYWVVGILVVMGAWAVLSFFSAVAQEEHSDRQGSFLGARMGQWILMSLVLMFLVYCFDPSKLGLIVVKAAIIFGFATMAFFFDRHVYPYARPDNPTLTPNERIAAGKRRNNLMCAAMLAGAWAA